MLKCFGIIQIRNYTQMVPLFSHCFFTNSFNTAYLCYSSLSSRVINGLLESWSALSSRIDPVSFDVVWLSSCDKPMRAVARTKNK